MAEIKIAWGLELGKGLLMMAAVLGIMWTVGKPHAENLIKDTVKEQGYATQGTIENMSSKLSRYNDNLEKTIEKLETEKTERIKIQTRQESILDAIKETNRLIRRQNQRGSRN